MADPVGVLGTAAGLVSLGLQLYSGIAEYLDAIEGRDADLASTHAQLKSLGNSLHIVEQISARAQQQAPNFKSDALAVIMKECSNELDQLKILLETLVGPPTSTSSIRARTRKLVYPFRRPDLVKLEDRLLKTNNAFQTALSALNLDTALDIGSKISNLAATQLPLIESKVVELSLPIHGMKTSIGHMTTEIESTASTMRASETMLRDLRGDFVTLQSTTASHLSTIETGLGTTAQRSDVSQLTTVAMSSAADVRYVATSVDRLVETTNQNLPQIADSLASIEQRFESLERFLGGEGALLQRSPQLAIGRLLAKPSLTQELYNDLYQPPALGRYQSRFAGLFRSPRCNYCMRRGNSTTTRVGFASMKLQAETWKSEHHPDCIHANVPAQQSRTTKVLKILAVSPRWLFSLGLQASIAMTMGAGGCSLSQNIVTTYVVDEEASPAFRVLNTLHEFLIWSHRWKEEELSRFINISAERIQRIYGRKQALPNDVNSQGQSMLHRWIKVLEFISWDAQSWEALGVFVTKLNQAGVSAELADFEGRIPVAYLAEQYYMVPESGISQTLEVLYSAASDPIGSGQISVRPDEAGFKTTKNYIFTRLLDCGPLSTAIILGDNARIKDLIKHESTLLEVNCSGQTPLHLAAYNTSLLMTLLKLSEPRTINLLDYSQSHVIDYILRYSARRCRNGAAWTNCSECDCSRPLDWLSLTDKYFDTWLSFQTSMKYLLRILLEALHSSRTRIIHEIVKRRAQLKSLALVHLNATEAHDYKLDTDNVIDYYAFDIIQCMEMKGVTVSAALKAGVAARSSVYHFLPQISYMRSTCDMAELLFCFGFRDLDEPNLSGETPLFLALEGWDYGHYGDTIFYVSWLRKRGVDLSRRLSTLELDLTHCKYGPLSTWVHLLLAKVGKSINEAVFSDQLMQARLLDLGNLITYYAAVTTPDACECYCTKAGCSLASLLFRNFWSHVGFDWERPCHLFRNICIYVGFDWKRPNRPNRPNRPSDMPQYIAREITAIFKSWAVELTEHDHVCISALRVLTFQALGMRHTCCNIGHPPKISEGDIAEIWSEERDSINRLENLQKEFEERFNAAETKFTTFLTSQWAPRMEEVLLGLEQVKMTDDEIARAESLGVEWNHEETPPAPKGDNSEDEEKIEYWIQQLNEITGD